MTTLIKGTDAKGAIDKNHAASCNLMLPMPQPLKEVCIKNVHVLKYLHTLQIDEVGFPQYVPQLNRKMGDGIKKNLLYPVSDNILIHVFSVAGEERDLYIPVEPSLNINFSEKVAKVETKLLEVAHQFAEAAPGKERQDAILESLKGICQVVGSSEQSSGRFSSRFSMKSGGGKILMTLEEYEAVKYIVLRDKTGMGVLQPMILDKHIEDISCSGIGSVFLEHKVFKSLKSTIKFNSHDDLDQFVLRLSERIKRPVTVRSPIVDAVLPDGSRINIVYGREVASRGSNFTIRKFSETPLSILELIDFGTLDYRMAAYFSIVLEEGMNAFVSGETASGKTTLINAVTTFIPPDAKIVSIEDTPEVQVPHGNWLREVAKNPRAGEKGAAVTMMDLLKAALRQRPNLIIIGEIRGEEGAIAFQAMQTGHAVMATFHAASVEKLIQRLTGHPINVPKTYVDNLNLVIIQSAVKLPTGKMGRRAISVNEIAGYDSASNSFSFVEVFRWDPIKDVFEFVGNKNSFLLEERIAPRHGLPPNRKWEIYNLLDKRAKILQRLHKEKGITGYYELYKVLAQAKKEGVF